MAAQGEPDPTFGNGGETLTEFFPGKSAQQLNALVIQHDPATNEDKLVAAGSVVALAGQQISVSGLEGGFGLIRYHRDGTPDANFGVSGNGQVVTNFSTFRPEPPNVISRGEVAYALTIDRSNRLVAAGSCSFDDGQSQRFAVSRYLPNGRPDTRFGRHGRVLTNISFTPDIAAAVVIQTLREPGNSAFKHFRGPDYPWISRIVVGGTSGEPATPPTSSSASYFTLVRYNAGGALDPRFGVQGIVRAPHFTFELNGQTVTSTFDQLSGLAVQADGKLVAAGTIKADGRGYIGLARFTTLGAPDTGFGNGGRVVALLPDSASDGQASARAVALQQDHKIVVSGVSTGTTGVDPRFLVARFDPDGTPDQSFGQAGFALTNVSQEVGLRSGSEGANAVLIQPDGKLVLAGAAESLAAGSSHSEFVLLRHHADGSLDDDFGAGGIVRTSLPLNPGPFGLPVTATANALALQADGRLVAGGSAQLGSLVPAPSWALIRYR